MRILQINSLCGVGSTGRIANDIHHLLQAQGHESLVAYARSTSKYCQDGYKFAGNLNFLIHVAYTFMTDRHAFASVLATRRAWLSPRASLYSPTLLTRIKSRIRADASTTICLISEDAAWAACAPGSRACQLR